MEEKSVGGVRRRVMDSWGTLLSGFKKRGANKAESHFARTMAPMTVEELHDIWHCDGFGARVVSCVAEDMTREGFRIVGDTCNIVFDELRRLNLNGEFKKCIEYARLYGGGAVLMGIDDGRSMGKPVSVNNIRGINYLKALPAPNVRGAEGTLVVDRSSPAYGTFSQYQVNDGISASPYVVHRDRLLLIPGSNRDIALAGRASESSMGVDWRIWGFSVLEPMRQHISDISLFSMSLSKLAQEAVIGKYKISGLADMLAMGGDEVSKIYTRLDVIDEAKSVINAVLLDADMNEDYARDSLSFSGINGVADTFMIFLSAVSGIPVTRLFGRSPSGLDASGESDLKIYYDKIHSEQESMLNTIVQRLVFYVNQYKHSILIEPTEEVLRRASTPEVEKSPIAKIGPSSEGDIHIDWVPLYQMSQKEQAETYFTNAQADMYYKSAGVLSAEEIRQNRFVNGYNQMMSVDTSTLPEVEEEIDDPSTSEEKGGTV